MFIFINNITSLLMLSVVSVVEFTTKFRLNNVFKIPFHMNIVLAFTKYTFCKFYFVYKNVLKFKHYISFVLYIKMILSYQVNIKYELNGFYCLVIKFKVSIIIISLEPISEDGILSKRCLHHCYIE